MAKITALFPPTVISLIGLLLFVLHLSSPTAGQSLYNICGTSGNFTANSTYQSNLNLLLSSLASNGSATGFTKNTVGQIPDQIYGLVLCRGDINATQCRSCLTTANQDLLQACPYNRAAMIWYDFCFLHFSNQQFLSTTDANSQSLLLGNTANATQIGRFGQLVALLLNSTTDWATVNSTRRFATGEVDNFTSDTPTIYGLVQCTPDLSQIQCRRCLRGLFDPLPTFLVGRVGGRVLGDRCTMRYEVYSFFQGAPTLKLTAPPPVNSTRPALPPAPPPRTAIPSAGGKGKKNVTGTVLAIAIPAVAAILVISIILTCFFRRRTTTKPQYEIEAEKITSVESILIDLATLRVATANFSEGNKLGEGGFGVVYKGLLPNGHEIAVKKLLNSGQGLVELKNELVLVAKLQHRNLVKLLGVCLEEEKMIVYEYVPNRSLDTFLFDPVRSGQLHWGTRYKIISGIARGLLYLHEESQLKIIHRDLKASNILLDADMNPKISDFGLAKLFDGEQTQGVTSRVMGTFGYMAPEYAMRGMFSIKSDVFSFGVLVLEILTGRKNSGNYDSEVSEDLLGYVWENWNKGTALAIVDPTLGGNYQGSNALRCIQIGLLCVQENPADRPTMRMVQLMLNSETVSLQPPSKPAFCVGKSSGMGDSSSYSSSSRGVGVYQRESKSFPMSPNEVSISELEPR